MSRDRVMGIRGFVFHQVKQIKELTNRLVQCWHNSYQLQAKLNLTEERLREAQKKYDNLVDNIGDVQATCPCIDQCPVKDLELS
jgi:uncharacterized coiled-coil protein SlyX